MRKINNNLLSLDRDEALSEHPTHTRAKWEEWKAEGYYSPKHKCMTDYEYWLRDYQGATIPQPMDHFTTRQIKEIAGLVIEELRRKGFECCGEFTFSMDECQYSLRISREDPWQKNVPYDYRVEHGSFNVEFTQLQEVWDALTKVPNRERRELEVLLRQTASLGNMAKEIRSKAARAFANELIEMSEKHNNLLTKQ